MINAVNSIILVMLCFAVPIYADGILLPPVGYSDFKTIRENKFYYTDKSLLIKEIVQSNAQAILVTRPRRWGKTLNLSMLSYFLNRVVDTNGDEFPDDEQKNSHRSLFKGLKIEGEAGSDANKTFVEQHQGKYPVIFMSFKDAGGADINEKKRRLGAEIYKAYREHAYLKNSKMLTEETRKEFSGTLEDLYEFSQQKSDRDFVLFSSLNSLTEYLYRHHGEKVFILIDEYDTPLNDVLGEPGFKDSLVLLRKILSPVLKDNSYLQKAVVTGILRVAKANIFSGLNNFVEDSLLTSSLSRFYGFTEEEVKELLDLTRPKGDGAPVDAAEELKQVKNWYNGYSIGGQTIYNPWSVSRYVSSRHFDNYWLDTSSDRTGLVGRLIIDDKLQEDLGSLRDRESIRKPITQDITADDLNDRSNSNVVWPLLFYTGYLTLAENRTGGAYKLKIPNREVAQKFKEGYYQWIEKDASGLHGRDVRYINWMVDAIVKNDVGQLGIVLGKPSVEIKDGWAYTPLHLAALMGDHEILRRISEKYPHWVDLKTNEGLNIADFALLGRQTLPEGFKQQNTVQEPDQLYSGSCVVSQHPSFMFIVLVTVKFSCDFLMKLWRSADMPGGNLIRPGSYPGQLVSSTLGVVGAVITGFFKESTGHYCKEHSEYSDIHSKSSFTTLRQFLIFASKDANSYVTVGSCSEGDATIASLSKPPLAIKQLPRHNHNFALCLQR
ncbi:MAG: AAA family ATPase [Myxococcota bacterium]